MSDNPLRWNSPFMEIEENASGWFWRLRTPTHYCLAVSPRDYKTKEEMYTDMRLLLPALEMAVKVNGLITRSLACPHCVGGHTKDGFKDCPFCNGTGILTVRKDFE